MEILACKGCGKLFNYLAGEKICPACKKKVDDKFTYVKKYVREHPNVGLRELSVEMEVSVAQINRWVREERLVFSDDSPIGIPCESCGVTIKTGRYCDKCKSELTNGLRHAAGLDKKNESAAQRLRQSSETKMRFLDK